jgi:L-amino acid N-acyltransferase YncA
MRGRLATRADAAAIAGIYNQGIEERTATFETDLRSEEEVIAWFESRHPIVVVETRANEDDLTQAPLVVAFARTSEYRPRECYRGVFEFAVYTDHVFRRRGAGALAMRELITHARAGGAWKLLSRIFVENDGSRALMASLGFREVGTYFRHAKLDGKWRDVVIVEKFLAPMSTGVEAAVGFLAGVRRDQILDALKSTSIEQRLIGVEAARSLIEPDKGVDQELLDAAADAFFMAEKHDSAGRGRFVDLFRAYASISPFASGDLYSALLMRLPSQSISQSLDAFYEALFVVKQVAFAAETTPELRTIGLAPHVPRLTAWIEEAILLPTQTRTRISPGNVTSLLMTLATAGCATEEQKRSVAELLVEAKAKQHRVETPVSLRSSVPPPALSSPPPPPTPPAAAVAGAETVPPTVVSPSPEAVHLPEPPPLPRRVEEERIAAPPPEAVAAPPASKKKRAPRKKKAAANPNDPPADVAPKKKRQKRV